MPITRGQALLLPSLALLPALGMAWEYQLIEGGDVNYAEQTPPPDHNLALPQQGAALRIPIDSTPAGTDISAAEFEQRMQQPHLVVIPRRRPPYDPNVDTYSLGEPVD